MLLNVSYNDPKIKRTIHELVGTSYGFVQSIKMGGTGSPRLVIHKASQEITNLLNLNNNINYCNIELRPEGIIIGFRALLESYALVIPYYKLVIYKPGGSYSFYVDQHYITFESSTKKNIKDFFDKVLNQKIAKTLPSVDEL